MLTDTECFPSYYPFKLSLGSKHGLQVNSQHCVWPAAPQASVQSFHVELELSQAQLADGHFVEASVAGRRRWEGLSYEQKQKRDRNTCKVG